MVSVGITQAREMLTDIRQAAKAFIECSEAYADDPTNPIVAEYLSGIDDKIGRYVRVCCLEGPEAMIDVTGYQGLNLGCGMLDQGHHLLNVDIRQTSLTDVIVDLEQFPWPFASAWADEIAAVDILEHIVYAAKAISECHRILKVGGCMRVRTTNWETEQSYSPWDHYHFATLHSFDLYDPETPMGMKYHFYYPEKFHIAKAVPSGMELEFELIKL